jgi:hypothetical protein
LGSRRGARISAQRDGGLSGRSDGVCFNGVVESATGGQGESGGAKQSQSSCKDRCHGLTVMTPRAREQPSRQRTLRDEAKPAKRLKGAGSQVQKIQTSKVPFENELLLCTMRPLKYGDMANPIVILCYL